MQLLSLSITHNQKLFKLRKVKTKKRRGRGRGRGRGREAEIINWAVEEFERVDLGDQRRNKRLIKVMSDLSRDIRASIVQCCDGWAATKAGYRLLSNEAVEWSAILEPHRVKTVARMARYSKSSII